MPNADDLAIAAYNIARDAFLAADFHATNVVKPVQEAASMLAGSKWQSAQVTGYPFPFPPGAGHSCINTQTWPTGEALGKALSNWHKAKSAMREAWDALDPSLRDNCEPPLC